MAKIVAFSNQKGGVGKTTTCINLGAYIALLGKKVLVCDMDPQGNASSGLGMFDNRQGNSLYEVLCDELEIKDAIHDTEIEGLKLLPASKDLAGAEMELAKVSIGRERVFEEKLKGIEAEFDYIFIDCPPALGLLTVNALTAADSVVVPIQCEYFALEGLSQLMNTVKLIKKYLNPSIEVKGVVITLYDGRSKLSQGVLEEIEKIFGEKVFGAKIPRNIRLAEAPSYGKPVALYDKKCTGAAAYASLAEEFIKKIN